MVRYSRVPAADSLIPSTRAISAFAQAGVELERDDLALAGGQLEPAPPSTTVRRSATSAPSSTVAAAASSGSVTSVATPLAAPQLVERRVAGDPEQPRPLLAAAAVERPPAAVGALERERGDVLGGGAVAEQRRDVGEHVVAAGAVQRLEAIPVDLGFGCRGKRLGARSHPHYEPRPQSVTGSISSSSCALALSDNGTARSGRAPRRRSRAGARRRATNPDPGSDQTRRSSRPRARSRCGRRSTSATAKLHRDTIGVRGQMPSLGFPAWLSMQIQLNY